MFHAELGPTVAFDNSDVKLYSTFLDSRPQKLETDAISLITSLQSKYPALRCHIVHLSASSALPLIRSVRATGLNLTAETCFHYLCLSAANIPDGEPVFKCCPPVREAANQDLLWAGLKEGLIDFVVSDHSPCVAELKKLDEGDIMGAWGGISTLGLGLSLLWTEGQRRGISIAQIVEWLSLKTAAHAGLGHLKGQLKVGLDGDFVIWDPNREFTVGTNDYCEFITLIYLSPQVTSDNLKFKNKISPYVGMTLRGEVEKTYLRGKLVYARAMDECSAERKPVGHLL